MIGECLWAPGSGSTAAPRNLGGECKGVRMMAMSQIAELNPQF